LPARAEARLLANFGHPTTLAPQNQMRTAAPRWGTAVSGRAGGGSAHLVAGRAQVLAGDDYPVGHAGLGRLAPRARVVELLVSDLAVDLQYGVVVAEHVVGDRAGVGVLRIGVDVHLHHAVVQRLPDLLEQRATAAVKHQLERPVPADLGADRVLDLLQDRRAQLDVAGLVHAVHVAEGGGQHVAALLPGAEHLGRAQRILGRSVEPVSYTHLRAHETVLDLVCRL